MRLTRSTFQTCAFWLAGPFVAAAVIEPLVNQTLQDHGVLKRPESWVWAMIVFLAHAFAARWFEILTGFVAGVSVGSWVDALLRRRETMVSTSQPSVQPASKISDLKADDYPISLRLQFSSSHETPIGLHQQNVLAWYVTWAHEISIDFGNEEGRKERALHHPRVYSVFILFDKPATFRQIIPRFSKQGDGVFHVTYASIYYAVVMSQGPIGDGVLEVYSANG